MTQDNMEIKKLEEYKQEDDKEKNQAIIDRVCEQDFNLKLRETLNKEQINFLETFFVDEEEIIEPVEETISKEQRNKILHVIAREYKKDSSNEPRVYVPPDPGTAIRVKEGHTEYLPPIFIPRLKYLEEVLQKLGINMHQDCGVWIGTNTANMKRILSYIIVIIPPEKVIKLIQSKEGVEIDESEVKERMVLLCEEYGSRTFVIDKIGDLEREYLETHRFASPVSPLQAPPTQEFHYYTDKRKSQLQALSNIIDLVWPSCATMARKIDTWKEKIKNLLTSKKILSRNCIEYYSPENARKDIEAFTKAAGLNHPMQLSTSNIHKGSPIITCSNGEPEVRGETYLKNAAIALGFAKNTREAGSIQSQTLKKLKKITGFENRENREYYRLENVLHDLEAFTEAAGLEDPTQLSTGNIRSRLITCSNVEPEIRGETYLKNALKVFQEKHKNEIEKLKKMKGNKDALDELKKIEEKLEEMKTKKNALKELKEIAGFEDRENREYYRPENVLPDLWELTKAAGLNHPMQLNTNNIQSKGRPGITCSNGEPEVKGQTYLRHTEKALEEIFKEEGISGMSATLKYLKKIAGFEVEKA